MMVDLYKILLLRPASTFLGNLVTLLLVESQRRRVMDGGESKLIAQPLFII